VDEDFLGQLHRLVDVAQTGQSDGADGRFETSNQLAERSAVARLTKSTTSFQLMVFSS
jgi:hypothetical protein